MSDGVSGAEWVRWAVATMFAALALLSVSRLLATGWQASARSVDVSRGVMSLGMVAMLVPQLDPLPRLWWPVLFGLLAGHIALRLIRGGDQTSRPELGGHYELHLVVGALAMVYMFVAMPAGHEPAHVMHAAGTASTGVALPVLAWVFVAYFLVFVVRLSARLAVPVSGAAASTPRSVLVSPQLSGSSEVVMGIGMSYMLVTML